MRKVYKNFIDNELQFCVNLLNDVLTDRLEKSIEMSYVDNEPYIDDSVKINLRCETDLSKNCGILSVIYTIVSARVQVNFYLSEEAENCVCYCDTALKIEYSNGEFDVFEIDSYTFSNGMWRIVKQEDETNADIRSE